MVKYILWKAVIIVTKFNQGDKAFIIENGIFVKEVIIIKVAGGFYTIKPKGEKGAYRVKEGRLFATENEANSNIRTNR